VLWCVLLCFALSSFILSCLGLACLVLPTTQNSQICRKRQCRPKMSFVWGGGLSFVSCCFAEVLPCLVYSHRQKTTGKHVHSSLPESFDVERTSTGVGLFASRSSMGNSDSFSTVRSSAKSLDFQKFLHATQEVSASRRANRATGLPNRLTLTLTYSLSLDTNRNLT
jgi:hypothetical protein